MQISMICTVMNEEKFIRKFVESVIKQTKKPNELIIVDGGSTDETYDILKKYSKKYSWIKVYQVPGLNIAEGRNYAIEHSKGDIIFTSDSSTCFENEWIEKIMDGFKQGGDVVFGSYSIKPKNSVENYLISRIPNWNKIDSDIFIPSNRNAAFKKEVWKKVGKFPSKIKRADDNVFHDKAHELGYKYVFIKDAVVYWYLNRNLKNMLKLAFLDSKSEGFLGIFLKRKIYIIELVVLFFLLTSMSFGLTVNPLFLSYIPLFLLLFVYEGTIKTYLKTKSIVTSVLGFFFSILLYFAHVSGVIAGIIQKIYKNKE